MASRFTPVGRAFVSAQTGRAKPIAAVACAPLETTQMEATSVALCRGAVGVKGLLRVKGRPQIANDRCLLFSRKRTFTDTAADVRSVPKADPCNAANGIAIRSPRLRGQAASLGLLCRAPWPS